MKGIINFISDFYKNSGGWIFASTLFNKFILFLIKVFVLMYVEKETFGHITYSLALLAFFTPFVGMGSPAGLLRFGSVIQQAQTRLQLAGYAFGLGLISTLFMIFLMALGFYFYEKDQPIVSLFLLILVWRMLALFLYNHQSAQMRIENKNKLFGQYDMVNSLVLLLSAVLLTIFFNATGYIFALVISPIITFIFYSFRFGFPKIQFNMPKEIAKKSFWNYAMLSSFTSVIAQIVFFLDVFLIEKFMTADDVAEYGAATLIPLNILILPLIFMRTDFTKIAQNELNYKFLRNYYKNYFYLFLIITSVGMLLSYVLGEWLFSFLDDAYSPFDIFLILMLGSCFAILLRVPLTGILNALGFAKINTITGLFTLFLSLGLNLYLIPIYGLHGAAWATTLSLMVSGVLSWIYFEWYLRKIKNQAQIAKD
ncbi:MAG: polysaccharide biosynthesis C-terminal domain-containing protein [Flavobacteriaceae bacterium]|nr:polysaccharide biosynthesis C-terminal domain-containing protein [Flavobacteriaceae bacterium]